MNYAVTISAVQHKTESPVTETRGMFVPKCAKSKREIAGYVSATKSESGTYQDCSKCFN